MADLVDDTEEPPLPKSYGTLSPPKPKGSRKSFGNLRRELTDDELQHSGTQKMLLDDLDRLENELLNARGFMEDFHKADKEVAVLKEKQRSHVAFEIIATGTTVVGSIFAGASFTTLTETDPQYGYLIAGLVLVLVGLIAKAIKL